MSMEQIRALLRVYTPGRRVRFLPEALATRERMPAGVTEGVILKLLPLAKTQETILPHVSLPDPYGVEVEIETPGGRDTMVFRTEEVAFLPSDEEELRRELVGRSVNFPRSSGIGIDFPPGAADDGIIVGIGYRDDPTGMALDRIVSLEIPVDPTLNPDGETLFRTVADFTQCQLMRKR